MNIYRILYLGEKSNHSSIAYVWTAVEVNIAIICCCMPAMRPILSRYFPRIFPDFSGRSTNTGERVGDSGPAGFSAGMSANHSSARNHHMLKELHTYRKKNTQCTKIRGVSPTGSEEEIMTYNGILRTTNFNVDVSYQDAKRSDASSNISSDGPKDILH